MISVYYFMQVAFAYCKHRIGGVILDYKKTRTSGERLKFLRKEGNLSRQELANLLDVSQQIIANIETDRTKITSLRDRELQRLCYHLLCTKDFLLMKSEHPKEYQNGLRPAIIFDPDAIDSDELKQRYELFPEAFQMLSSLTMTLPKEKKQLLLRVLEAFMPTSEKEEMR
ncbi:MAG: helix-turn-helix transcriptional regulator [Clostridia bacterium]|nr:helix-turn-helix transcriptional regulator [Clostridia bacterium]